MKKPKTLELKYEEVPTKVPEHFRLDGWTTGVEHRRFCALLFPKGISISLAMKIIRRKLGMVSLEWDLL